MGFSIQSAVTQQTLNDFTSIVNQSVESVINSSSQTCNAVQELDINIGQPFVQDGILVACEANFDGSVNISQTNKQQCQLTQNAINNLSANINTTLQKNLQQWIQTGLDSKQGFFPAAFSAQLAVNQTSASIATRISNGLTANIQNTCKSFYNSSQSAKFNICGNFKKDFNFDQNINQMNLTSCLSQNTVSFISNDNVLENMAQTADTKLSSDQEGLTGWIKWLIIGAVILGVVIIIGIILYLLFGGSKNAVKPEQLSVLVNPELRVCAIRAKEQLEREGRPITPRSERFLVERCLAEKRRERDFESNRDQYSRREGGEWRRREEGEGRREEGRREEGRREE